ncbi:Fibronectin type III [uncultured Caudovirales phage]|uniref:Fibronectin type III n=1 Tax=uncultured Caudovirales phage TaxID=2100421 RepID=A0A6J5SY06_9CAUD|nr:Fibronectin type III [uncultured Caudovirales phage]
MSSKPTRVSPGVYRDATGRVIYIPKRSITLSSRGKQKPKTSNNKEKETKVRGTQVSVRASAANAITIYGTMRVGGVYTYLNTDKNSRSYLKTGSENSQIVWVAREKGSTGNEISVRLFISGTIEHTTVSVIGKAISVRMRETAGESRSRPVHIVEAIKNNAAANALVTVHVGDGTGIDFAQPIPATFLADGGGTILHHFITLAGHEITAIDALYLDDRLVTFGAAPDPRWAIGTFIKTVFMAVQYGTEDQITQPDLTAMVGAEQWGPNHRQRGCAGAYLITVFKADVFPSGIPDVEFLVRGKKVYDFRDQTVKHTSNAALILADFLCDQKLGAGIPRAHLNVANWSYAANVCDELVSLAAGGNEARYSINGTFDSGASVENIIDEMLQAMAGDLVYQGGEWFCNPGEYRAVQWSLFESDLLEEISISTAVARRDRFNAVRGTYVNAADNFAESDYTSIKNNYYALLDGQVIFEDIPQPFVTSNPQAQRIAKIELERVRQGIEVDLVLGAEALSITVCDLVTFTYSRLGWASKVFEVRDIKISDTVENGLRVALKLRETAAGIFTWSAEETQIDLAPNTDLPSPYDVGAPTNLSLSSGTEELYIRNDGTVITRLKATWIKPNDIYVIEGGRYEVQSKPTASADWLGATIVEGDRTSAYLLDVQDGQRYDVRVRSVNTIGVSSSYVTFSNHLVLGKSVPPTTPGGFSAAVQSFGILFQWAKVADLDVREYELRLGSTWELATQIARVSAVSFTLSLKTAGVYTALLKAVDTSGNYSAQAASVVFTIQAPSAPILTSTISGQNVILSWTESTGAFAIDSYLIKYGSTLNSAVTLAQVKALNFTTIASWLGVRTFYVQAVDVAGNLGNSGQTATNILAPNSPTGFTADVIDNNVLLRWTTPSVTSLPIVRFELKKGATYGQSESLGSTFSTFSALFELQAGLFTYYVSSVDSAGNLSEPSSVTAKMDQPPDFEFFGSHNFNFLTDSPTLSDASVISSSSILLPTSHETWTDHFSAHGWTSISAQISEDYLYLVHPTDTTASIEVVHDFGATVSSTLITLSYLTTILSGAVAITPTISVSLNGSTWVASASGLLRVFAQNVRYVKILLSAVASTDKGLALVDNLSVALNVKEGTLAGSGTTAASGATLGRLAIDITGEFSDVISVAVTAGYNSGFGVVAVYDLLDAANPTTFTVYTYRADTGAAVGGIPFSYNLRGYIA